MNDNVDSEYLQELECDFQASTLMFFINSLNLLAQGLGFTVFKHYALGLI